METKGGHGIDDSLQTEVVVLSRILSSQNFHFTREAKVVVSSPPNVVVFAEYFFADFPPSTKKPKAITAAILRWHEGCCCSAVLAPGCLSAWLRAAPGPRGVFASRSRMVAWHGRHWRKGYSSRTNGLTSSPDSKRQTKFGHIFSQFLSWKPRISSMNETKTTKLSMTVVMEEVLRIGKTFEG